MKITIRDVPPRAAWALEQAGVHPLLAKLYAARGVHSKEALDDGLARLLPPEQLHGAAAAGALLADALAANRKICIVADYDCDGATACAVAVRGLKLLGAQAVAYLVPEPHRRWLRPDAADRRACRRERCRAAGHGRQRHRERRRRADRARALGLQVLVTDHHLPGSELPAADVIVNPNQPGCGFESKSIAGVGVMFYVLLALRAELRRRGAFTAGSAEPRLDTLLPLVALGTVADVVRLDANNRRLVAQGLRRIRAGALPAGIAALFEVAGRSARNADRVRLRLRARTTHQRGRTAGRHDARHRVPADRRSRRARRNSRRRSTASTASGASSKAACASRRSNWPKPCLVDAESEDGAPPAISVFDAAFHEGVVGIVASRLKDRWHRPSFVFAASQAPGKAHELKGSGRSIPGFHLRDALDLVAKRHPGVLLRFGGHAMAAGCTIDAARFETFQAALAQVAREWLDAATLTRQLDTDGALPPEYRRAEMVDTLHREVWGQGFAAPTFSEEVEVLSQRLVGERHLALKLKHAGEPVDGIWFGRTESLPARVTLAFRLEVDEWKGARRVRFLVEGAEG